MKKLTPLLFLLFLCILCSAQQTTSINTDPEKVKFITSDIPRFWVAFDSATRDPQRSVAIYDQLYFKEGSYGLGIFKTAAIGSTEVFANKIAKYHLYYQSIRKNTLNVPQTIPAMRESLYKLKAIYPQAIFPDVYIVIGCMSSGGRSMKEGLFLGADVNCAHESSDFTNINPGFAKVLKSLTLSRLPIFVAHELAHYQQNYTDSSKNVLSRAIVEGSADFICKLTTGMTANNLLQYGEKHEKELWMQFKNDLYSSDIQKWFYYPSTENRPSDLGYYIGFKITEAYYLKAKDKKKAIVEILNISNFSAFLKKSSYASKF
nr:DUF2268 domain-containing putative Zn-dependent protease [Pedobacter sp. ASV2]